MKGPTPYATLGGQKDTACMSTPLGRNLIQAAVVHFAKLSGRQYFAEPTRFVFVIIGLPEVNRQARFFGETKMAEKQKPIPSVVHRAAQILQNPKLATQQDAQRMAARILDDQKNDPQKHGPVKKK
jgi:hypothetical protein